MDERNNQLAQAIVNLEVTDSENKKTTMTRMKDKQPTFRYEIHILIHV